MAAEIQVASIIAPVSMPVVPRMEGLTKMMYAIVKKVVRPATISVRTVVLFSFNLKKSFRDTVDSFAMGSHSSNVFSFLIRQDGREIPQHGLLKTNFSMKVHFSQKSMGSGRYLFLYRGQQENLQNMNHKGAPPKKEIDTSII